MKLKDVAAVLRSKNSGPFEITLDAIFKDPVIYHKIKAANVITREHLAELYQISPEQIIHIVFYDQALGFKCTFNRKVSSGTYLDRDVYGAQQFTPLAEMEVYT